MDLRILSAAEQVAAYLEADIREGKLSGLMPGVLRMEAELGVNRNTLEAALKLLEQQGHLISQGPGKRRRIQIPASHQKDQALNIAILLSDRADQGVGYMIMLMHELKRAGHTAFFVEETILDLKLDIKRISKLIKQTTADAWIVVAGTEDVLELFTKLNDPVIALFGRRRNLSIPSVGPNKIPPMIKATERLMELGHKRIVLLARQLRRKPKPGAPELAFLRTLAKHGIQPGPYHLPDWDDHIDAYHSRLESMFKMTPPTALIIDEAHLFHAAQQYLSTIGLRVPHDVSLICTDYDPSFSWCKPSVAHIQWKSEPLVRRLIEWTSNVALGKEDNEQTLTRAAFIEGGTITKARKIRYKQRPGRM